MGQKAIELKLEGLNIDLERVDAEVKNGVYLLYNPLEDLSSTNRDLQVENQVIVHPLSRKDKEGGGSAPPSDPPCKGTSPLDTIIWGAGIEQTQ
ncbi:hypothetical protein MBAV_001336 [Candidatus Magnetobacterium bavaricum]|uniref:Uncharacterized protein n=1 Tax=Candidatus Magnetobacterium bavaricum TaxID=29290 RepID=A0A0F3H0N0_9BACT|nr:hypothetical protein MBAV_001336 [Candidatus Magnetobacterium bavaricum]